MMRICLIFSLIGSKQPGWKKIKKWIVVGVQKYLEVTNNAFILTASCAVHDVSHSSYFTNNAKLREAKILGKSL